MSIQSLKKWGNSPAVRIPAAVMEAAQLTLDQAVEIRAENGRVIIEPVPPAYALADLLAGISADNRHGDLSFGEPQGRESL
ncbi:MAG: AbrB/MazE/SpoVT family DNA-binding domain-containing protein [Candidatus Methylumidiphilus sp.]